MRIWYKKASILNGAGIQKAPLTQYSRRGLHENVLFTENARRSGIRKLL